MSTKNSMVSKLEATIVSTVLAYRQKKNVCLNRALNHIELRRDKFLDAFFSDALK